MRQCINFFACNTPRFLLINNFYYKSRIISFGNFGAGFLFVKNVVDVINVNVNGYLEFQTPKGVFIGLGNYHFLRGNGKSLYDNTFYHVRYNYKINK